MKRFIVFLCAMLMVFSVTATVKADVIFNVDFETPDVGYTVINGFSTGSDDYWIRTDGSNITTDLPYSGIQGSWFMAGEDTDGGGVTRYVGLTLNSVNVSGYTDLRVSLLLAAGGDGNWYEGDDYISLQYSMNSGAFTKIGRFSGDSYASSSPLRSDTDFNGLGDGIALTSAFQKFTYIIPETGSALQVMIETNMNSSHEEVALDNFLIEGTPPTPPVPEPSAIILLGSGLIGLVGLKKKLKK